MGNKKKKKKTIKILIFLTGLLTNTPRALISLTQIIIISLQRKSETHFSLDFLIFTNVLKCM